MDLNEVMGKIMVALDEVSSFNLTADMGDYEFKMYEAIDSTQRELACLCSPIEKVSNLTAQDGVLVLPDDLYELLGIYDHNYKRVGFKKIERDKVLIDDGTYIVKFNRYPTAINNSTPLSFELEIDKDAQEALIYGVCALLCINDDPEAYNTYIGRYTAYINSILSRKALRPNIVIEGGVDI